MNKIAPHPSVLGAGVRFRPCRLLWSSVIVIPISVGFARALPPPAVTFQFVDVSSSRGIGPFQMSQGMGGGVAAADFDEDGDIDFFVPNGAGIPDQLYRNLGNGLFEEIAAAAGVGSTRKDRCALWFDYDGDGDLDLLVANDDPTEPSTFHLYRQNANASFEDVTVTAGLFIPLPPEGESGRGRHRGGMCAGDLNRDGFLDVFAPMWNGAGHLLINNRNGTFTDATVSSGLGSQPRFGHQGLMVDVNKDGWLDIYGSIDFGPNVLWINQHDGTFVETAASAGAANAMNDMGMALGDYDQDGDLDIYITNIFGSGVGWNVLLRNDGVGGNLAFSDVAPLLGVNNGSWGWGATFIDGDNDGWIDIAATNGWSDSAHVNDVSRFFRNLGGHPPSFVEASTEVRFNDTEWGSALIAFDFDRDGDLDMLQACMGGPLRLLENVPANGGHGNSYLVIKPRISGPNHYAIGTAVWLEVGGKTTMRLITAGTSYMGQEPAEAFFGVGNALMVNDVTLRWPDGRLSFLHNVAVNQVLTVFQPANNPIPAVSERGLAALVLLILAAGMTIATRHRT